MHRFDKRVLAGGCAPAEYLTLDKKRLVVDLWPAGRQEPLAVFISVATLDGARARIEDIGSPNCAKHFFPRGGGGTCTVGPRSSRGTKMEAGTNCCTGASPALRYRVI